MFRHTLLFALLALCATGPALAETVYVSDELEITLRKGTSTRHEILRMLPSGTRLQVLEHDRDSGYTRVRIPSGTEGWVLSRFVMKQPAAREQLAKAEKRIAELELEKRRRLTEAGGLEQKYETLKTEHASLTDESNKLAQELENIRRTASSSLALSRENGELRKQIVEVQHSLEALRLENDSLRDRTRRDWFLVGGGVMLAGIIAGLIIPRLRLRRKPRWGDTF